mmetsp:Transcript_13893/g.39982  ORF Transcript_13893/g.39982 Transcript_13893/m.39982 type:complete len:136 (-) Transcript_13893:72-479(-)
MSYLMKPSHTRTNTSPTTPRQLSQQATDVCTPHIHTSTQISLCPSLPASLPGRGGVYRFDSTPCHTNIHTKEQGGEVGTVDRQIYGGIHNTHTRQYGKNDAPKRGRAGSTGPARRLPVCLMDAHIHTGREGGALH